MALLFDKDSLQIKRIKNNNYVMEGEIRNLKIDANELFSFQKFPILKELYKDIIDELQVTNIQEGSASYGIIFQHFFKDMGFPRLSLQLDVTRTKTNNMLEFVCSNATNIVSNSQDCFILSFETFAIQIHICEVSIKICIDIAIHYPFEIELFIEKMAIQVMHKMFLRLKRFIEI
uniref:Uncharacterized protein n=1 Tax=viral metagenome TaxID=1070528 RepID=A0A6C0BAZ7_9ZZZZ